MTQTLYTNLSAKTWRKSTFNDHYDNVYTSTRRIFIRRRSRV